MAMRMSGLMSGMDTESIVQQLVEVRSKKVTTVKNSQTKLEWKQDIWKGLNTKLKTLQSKLNDLRFSGAYAKKKTTSSNESVASVLTSDTAVNGTQTLEVNRLAKTAYLTGGKVSKIPGARAGEIDIAETQMDELMEFAPNEKKNLTLNKADGSQVVIDLTYDTTVSDVLSKMKSAGLNASFDTKQQRFFISSRESGKAGNFMFTGDSAALNALGLDINQTAANRPKWLDGDPTGEKGNVRGSSRLDQLIDFSKGGSTNPVTGARTRTLRVTRADGLVADIQFEEFTRNENGVRHFNTVDDFVKELRDFGVDAAFDPVQMKFTVGEGVKIESVDEKDDYGAVVGNSDDVLDALGLSSLQGGRDSLGVDKATFIHGQDAMITLNGAVFTNNNNTFEVNGLTITAQNETEPGKSVTLTTQQDTDGIYDMVKDFFKTYNEVINEIDKLYNGESAKGYEPLTDEEKSAMSEKEVEKYEQKIKDSLLRRDSSLSSIGTELKKWMMASFSVNGEQMSLASFGIETLNYFVAPDNERNAYHIDGDKDDLNVSSKDNKLKAMIASDPDAVISFFTQLSQTLYTKMNEHSQSIEGYRSFGSFYDDKKMKSDYDSYKSKIKEEEKKLSAYEDKWYAKFAKMESAMAKMQQSASAVTGLLGGQ